MKKVFYTWLILACLIFNAAPIFSQTFKNDISFPSETYMLSDVQNDIFIQPFLKRWRPYDNYVRFSSPSIPFSRRLEKFASVLKPEDGKLKIQLYEGDDFNVIKTIESNVKAGKSGVGDKEVVVQIIGDSYTNGAFFKDALLIKGYVPRLKMVGLRRVNDMPDQFDEGRGGCTLESYFTVTKVVQRAYNGFWQPKGNDRYWGSTSFWKMANDFRKNPNLNPATNKSWDFGDLYNISRFDSVSFRFDENTGFLLNPHKGDVQFDNALNSFVLYNGRKWEKKDYPDLAWSFQYGKYLSMWNITPPQMLFEMLGLNDFRDKINHDFLKWNARLMEMKKSYLEAVPDGKFVICTPASSCGILDNAAGDFTTMQNAAMWEVRDNIIKTFDGQQSDKLFILDVAVSIDNEKGYRYQDGIQMGNPHPFLNYPAMGISIAAFIQYHRQ